MTQVQIQFDRFYQKFFNTFLMRRPVTASFVGKHEYDHLLPDFSPAAVAETISEMKAQLDEIRTFCDCQLTRRQKLDKKQIEGYLEIQLWEYSEDCYHFHRGNPSMYVGEAIFGLIVCLLTDYAPLEMRLASLKARLEAVPAFFAQAKENLCLCHMPKAWAQRAMRECDSALNFLNLGLPKVDSAICTCAAKAAFEDFKAWLESNLDKLNNEGVASGEKVFSMMMEKAHFVKTDLNAYADYALSEVERATKYLDEHCADFGAATPGEALAQLADIHPDAEGYLPRFMEMWTQLHDMAVEKELVTWPEFPIAYGQQPDWARECASGLYFLNYRCPAAFNRPVVHEYLAPTPAQDLNEAFLRGNNDSVIKSNHVIHHGGLGHHVQNWNAFHQTNSFVGQFAACDGASRLTMMSAGTMAEGWAVYATHLADEFGFLTPLEHYSEMQSHRRMAARAVVDIKLHLKEWSLEEAAAFYHEKAGMPEGFAMSEAVKNSMFPGGAVIYLLGCDTIFAARKQMQEKLGDKFSLKAFHDEFLSCGAIPAELSRQAMMGEI